MKYGQELLDELRTKLEQNREEYEHREERIARGDVEASDCMLSIWANDINCKLLKARIKILEAGGLAEFDEIQLLDGTPVQGCWCKTRYGRRFITKSGVWISPYVREETLARKGYKIGKVMKPAWAKIKGSGHGLAGAMTCYVDVFPSRVNYWTGEGTAQAG